MLLDAALAPEGALGRALATAMAVAADQTFKEVVGEAIRKRDAVRTWIDHGGGIEGAFAGLCGALGVGTDDSIERIDGEITDGPLLPASQWARPPRQCSRAVQERSGAGAAARVWPSGRPARAPRSIFRCS